MSEDKEVLVTLGLVTLNEERTIGLSLSSLLSELSPLCGEIIVVAGGEDRTVEIVRDQLAGVQNSRLIVDSEPKGKPAALNSIRSLARGNIIVLSDGDVVIESGAVHELLKGLSDPDVGCASGKVTGRGDKNNKVTLACDFMTHVMHLSRIRSMGSMGSIELASGYLIAVRRELMPELPLSVMSDDGYISRCVRRRGYKIAYIDDSRVKIKYPKSFQDFFRQKVRTRFGHMQLNRLMPASAQRTLLVEIRDYLALRKHPSLASYSSGIRFLAGILSLFVWVVAETRVHVPFMFKRRLWVPVESTK